MSTHCELHFQEGFSGETVAVAVNGEIRLRFEARTRLQTGLARLEILDVNPGETITISVPQRNSHGEFRPSGATYILTVNLVAGVLLVRPAASAPGYI